MNASILTGVAALALLAAPALAQEAATAEQPAAGGQQAAAAGDPQMMMDTAIQSAEGVGMTSVAAVEGAFVLQGLSATGEPILMAVGPAGELLGIANPLLSPSAEQTAATGTATAETGSAEAAEGEPAEEGFMATQTQPASPQMWDPSAFEGHTQGSGGAAGAAAGTEQPQQ